VFDARDLQAFARFMTGNKGPLENLLGHEVRADIGKKPTQQLGLVLKMLGLKLARAGSVRVSGHKVRRYRLEPDALREMQELVAAREGKKAWSFLVDRYGPHMDPSESDEWDVPEPHGWADPDDEWPDPGDDDWAEAEERFRRIEEFVRRTTRRFL
jgi:hypothetical protein